MEVCVVPAVVRVVALTKCSLEILSLAEVQLAVGTGNVVYDPVGSWCKW